MVEVIIKNFEGFAVADFDAYSPEKWISNLFNRERMLITQKLAALGNELKERLGQALAELEPGTSDDRPSFRNQNRVDHQLLYFLRPAAERQRLSQVIERKRPMTLMISDPAVHQQHLYLGIRIELAGLQLGLFLHGHAHLDKENLAARLARQDELEAFTALVRDLGPGWSCTDAAGAELACASIEPGELLAQVRALQDPASCWAVRRVIGREDEEALGAGFRELAAGLLRALLPLYSFIAWSSDNDQIEQEARLRREAEERAEAEARAEREAQELAEQRKKRQEEARARSEEAEWDRRILSSRLRRPAPPPEEPASSQARGSEAAPAPRRADGAIPQRVSPEEQAGSATAAGAGTGEEPAAASRERERSGEERRRPPEGPEARQHRDDGRRRGPWPAPGASRMRDGREQRPAERDAGLARPPAANGERGWRRERDERQQHPPDRPAGDAGLGVRRPDGPPGRERRFDRAPWRGREDGAAGKREPHDRRPEPRSAPPAEGRPEWRRPAAGPGRQAGKPGPILLEVGETVRFERGLMAGKEGQIEAIDEAAGLLTVSIRGLKVRVGQLEVKKVQPGG